MPQREQNGLLWLHVAQGGDALFGSPVPIALEACMREQGIGQKFCRGSRFKPTIDE